MRRLSRKIESSERAARLKEGVLSADLPIYHKWKGAHWQLAALAEMGYPPGDAELKPAAEKVLAHWASGQFQREYTAETKKQCYKKGKGVPILRGKYRRCASQQGNALLSFIRLGFDSPLEHTLANLLLKWQWPDGGWNCDKREEAKSSSFMETLLPARALIAYGKKHNHPEALKAARRAAEVFLTRHLYKRRRDGAVIDDDFIRLHYPLYWHYDIVGGLKALQEQGLLEDHRCGEAIHMLMEKALPAGGWAVEKKFYTVSENKRSGTEVISWGPNGGKRMNPWISLDALTVLSGMDII